MTKKEYKIRKAQVARLHKFLIAQDIIPEVILAFDEEIPSSFLEETDEHDGIINLNIYEAEIKNGGLFNHLKVYLHEAGHVFHYYEGASDYDKKSQWRETLLEIIYKNVPEELWQKVYDVMPTELEANILADVMWEQLQSDLPYILEG